MDDLRQDIVSTHARVALGLAVADDELAGIEERFGRLVDQASRPRGVLGRVLGFDPATIIALAQLVLLLFRLIRKVLNQRNS